MSMRNALDHITAAVESEIASRSNRYADKILGLIRQAMRNSHIDTGLDLLCQHLAKTDLA
jgi:hypothetical protein